LISKQRRLRNALGVSLIVTICVIVGLLLQRSREQAIDDLQRDTRNLTAALALYARGIVTSVDLALVGARDSLALLEFTEHGPARAELGNQVLRSNVERIGLPVFMRVLDADAWPMPSPALITRKAGVDDNAPERVSLKGIPVLSLSAAWPPCASVLTGRALTGRHLTDDAAHRHV